MNGLELRELRKKFKLSRGNFAGLLNVSIHTLDAWESGKRNISKTKSDYIELKMKDLIPMDINSNKVEKTDNKEKKLDDIIAEKVIDKLKPFLTDNVVINNKLDKLLGLVSQIILDVDDVEEKEKDKKATGH